MLGSFSRLFIRGRASGQCLSGVNVAHIAMMNSAHFSHILRVHRRTGSLPLIGVFGKRSLAFITKDS